MTADICCHRTVMRRLTGQTRKSFIELSGSKILQNKTFPVKEYVKNCLCESGYLQNSFSELKKKNKQSSV